MAWTFRSDLVAGLHSTLSDFLTANPTLLNSVHRSRPKNLSNRPLAFVGPRNEVLAHTQGIHRRTVSPTVVIVYAEKDYADEMADIRDDVVDAFLEFASGRPHAVSGQTLIEPRSTEDVELNFDGASYPATVVTYIAVDQKGRTTGL